MVSDYTSVSYHFVFGIYFFSIYSLLAICVNFLVLTFCRRHRYSCYHLYEGNWENANNTLAHTLKTIQQCSIPFFSVPANIFDFKHSNDDDCLAMDSFSLRNPFISLPIVFVDFKNAWRQHRTIF